MSLENRVRGLERVTKASEVMKPPNVTTNEILIKLGLKPDEIRAEAKETGETIVSIVAGKCGLSFREFDSALKARVRGRR